MTDEELAALIEPSALPPLKDIRDAWYSMTGSVHVLTITDRTRVRSLGKFKEEVGIALAQHIKQSALAYDALRGSVGFPSPSAWGSNLRPVARPKSGNAHARALVSLQQKRAKW